MLHAINLSNESESKVFQEGVGDTDRSSRENRKDSGFWQDKKLALGFSATVGVAALYSIFKTAGWFTNNSKNSQNPFHCSNGGQKLSSSNQKPHFVPNSNPGQIHLCINDSLQSNSSSISPPICESKNAPSEKSMDLHPPTLEDNLAFQPEAALYPIRNAKVFSLEQLSFPPPRNPFLPEVCSIDAKPLQEPVSLTPYFVFGHPNVSQTCNTVLPVKNESAWQAVLNNPPKSLINGEPFTEKQEVASKDSTQSVWNPFLDFYQHLDSYIIPALPWVIGALSTMWFAKRYLFGNGELPAIPNLGAGLAALPILPPPPGDMAQPGESILNAVEMILPLLPPPIHLEERRTITQNLEAFYLMLERVHQKPTNQNLETLTTLSAHLLQDLDGSLEGNSNDSIENLLFQRQQVEEMYRNTVNDIRTIYPLLQIHQDSRVGARENVENIEEETLRIGLQGLGIASIRRIAGDGNCFYTSLATLLLEAIAERRFHVTEEWLHRHFHTPNSPDEDLFRFSIDLLRQAQKPDQLQAILQDSNQMLPFVRYLRAIAAHSIQRGWIWDSIIHSPDRWLNDQIRISANNMPVFRSIQQVLWEYQSIHEEALLSISFSQYVETLEAPNADQDPILALFLCILARSQIEDIVNARGIDPDSHYSIRFFLTDARFLDLEDRFNRLTPNPNQRQAYEACKAALRRLKENIQHLREIADTPEFQMLLDELINTLGERPDSLEGQLISDQAEGWRAALFDEFNDPQLENARISDLIERFLESMGRDAMQQTIEALSRQLALPIEINMLAPFPNRIPSTIDGREAIGSVVKNGEHYFVGYR